jgi:hypothetical protein
VYLNTNGHGSGGRRRTRRITLQIPLMITGRDEHGSVFADHVLTENVSKDGGCLLFRRDLRRNCCELRDRKAPAFSRRSDGACITLAAHSPRGFSARSKLENWLGSH